MSTLIWDTPEDRFYEAGVDRGVLYIEGKPGIPWNGLVGVVERPTIGDRSHLYFDGVKQSTSQVSKEYEATITAYTYPDLFSLCDGTAEGPNGLLLEDQPRTPFSFSYRTKIGDGIRGTDSGYKLHIVYNAKATPSEITHASMSNSTTPANFSWSVYSVPDSVIGFKDTSHLIIDSREANSIVLAYLESRLYGTEGVNAYLPTAQEIYDLFGWEPPWYNGPANILGPKANTTASLENLNAYPSFEKFYPEASSVGYEVINESKDPLCTSGTYNLRTNNNTIYRIDYNQPIPEHPQGFTTGAMLYLVNLVPFGNFEDGAYFIGARGGITQHTLGIAPEGVSVGRYVASGDPGGNYIIAALDNAAPVIPNTTYEFAAKARRGSSFPDRSWGISVYWYDASGALLTYPNGTTATPVGGGNFIEFKEKFVSPPNAASARVRIFCTSIMNADEIMYFDDIRAYRPTNYICSAYNLDGLLNTYPTDRIIGCWAYVTEEGYGILTNSNTTGGSMKPIPANTWVWVKPPTANGVPANTWAGLWMARLSGEQASHTVRGYITGITTRPKLLWNPETISGDMVDPHGGIEYRWEGEPNKSRSIAKVKRAMGANVPMSVTYGYPTKKWSRSGSYSLSMRSSYYNLGSAFVDIASHTVNFGPKLVRGRTYTILAYCNVTEPYKSPNSSYARALAMIVVPQAGGGSTGVFSQAPNATGIYLVRLKITVPPAGDSFYIRLYHGGTAEDPEIFWDGEITVIEGDYEGPGFDGDSEIIYKNQKVITSWSGVEHESQSTMKWYTELESPGQEGDAHIIDGNIWAFTNGAWTNYGPEPEEIS